VKHYSSGMYVRLGFAVAVHVKPEILMIDEVIAVGDEEFQRRCFDHIYKLRREGVTIVMVSHGSALMEQMCDEVAWLDHGHLMAKGDPSEVVRKYLDQVNIVENERRAETTGEIEVVPPDARRWGSGELEIVGLEYLDAAGKPLRSASTGDPLVIRIRYRAHAPIEDPVFALGVYNASGVNIAGPNTGFAGVSAGTVTGDGHVDYVIDRLNLMPGGWQVSVAAWDQGMMHTYDQLEKQFDLHVQPGSSVERFGLADLQGSWRMREND
jgi:lipopolysaccharide transport system ATP-binding protein